MTYRGYIENGTVVLYDDVELPEGASVLIYPEDNDDEIGKGEEAEAPQA